MEDVLSLSASAVSGGILGVLGTAANRLFGIFEARQAAKEREAERRHELHLHELNAKARAAETERELDIIAAQGSFAGLTASLTAEAAIGPSYKWVEAVRALVRPVMTPLLWALALVVFFQVVAADAAWMAEAERAEIVGYLVSSIIFAATAATLWWFGDRAPRAPNLNR